MPTPQELLTAVRELKLPTKDLQEIERRLTEDKPSAADFASVKAIIRTRTLESIPTEISQADADAFATAEKAAATLAIASLQAINEEIDTVTTALKHGEL